MCGLMERGIIRIYYDSASVCIRPVVDRLEHFRDNSQRRRPAACTRLLERITWLRLPAQEAVKKYADLSPIEIVYI